MTTTSHDISFWRNAAIIAVAHVAVLIGVMRWGGDVKKRTTSDVIWIGGGGALAVAANEPAPEPAPVLMPVAAPSEEAVIAPVEDHQEPASTEAPSEVPLATPPAPTAKPKPTPAPKTASTPKPKPSPSAAPKSTPKATPKKTLLAKASPKPSVAPAETKTEAANAHEPAKPAASAATAKTGSGSGENPTGAAGAAQSNWYGNMLHDRFHGEWVQPKTAAATGSKMSTLVQLRIERDGRVSDFRIVASSGNVVVDESIAAVAKRVTQVDPPPAALSASGHYAVRIRFELDVE